MNRVSIVKKQKHSNRLSLARCLYIVLILLCWVKLSTAQGKERLLQWAGTASTRISTDSLYNIHFSFDDEDPAYCISLGNALMQKAIQEKNKTAEGVANIILANGITYQNSREASLVYRNRAIELLANEPASKYLVYAYTFLAELTGDMGNRDSADVLFDKAMRIIPKLNDPEISIDILVRHCQEHRRSGKYAEALENINAAKDLVEKHALHSWEARIDLELADLLKYSGNDSLYVFYSVEAFNNAVRYNQGLRLGYVLLKTANCFLDFNKPELVSRTAIMLDSMGAHPDNINFTLIRNSFWAKYYKHAQQYQKALGYLLFNVDHERKNNWGTTLGYLYNDIGACYRQLGRYDKALLYFDSVYTIAKKSQYQQLMVEMLPLKAATEKQVGNFSASANTYEEFSDLYKNITRESNENKIAIMQALFDIRNREQTIDLLTKENELQLTQLNQQRQIRWLFAGIIALLLTLAALLYYYLRRTHRANKKLQEQKMAIEESSKQLQEQASAISRYKTQMNPHFIFNAINSVQQLAIRHETNNLMNYLQEFSRLMRQTLDNSDKEYLTVQHEVSFLQQYLEFERKRLSDTFTYDISVAKDVEADNVLLPPMLVQPIVENALKHAVPYAAKGNISIHFSRITHPQYSLLQVLVEDNGPGLKQEDKDIYSPATHISKGLLITRQRISSLLEKHQIREEGFSMTEKTNGQHGVVVLMQIPYLEEF